MTPIRPFLTKIQQFLSDTAIRKIAPNLEFFFDPLIFSTSVNISYCKFLINLNNVNLFSAVRFCEQCLLIKPDRAHHCSVCGTCVLKMDHHCPWVNNCVGFHNYKFFMLFLAYAFLYCTFITATSLQYFVRFWKVILSNFQ